jgi:hypothetical protein
MRAINLFSLLECLNEGKYGSSNHPNMFENEVTLRERELEILNYIASVELEDVKWIMEMRFIDGLGWHDIASEWEEKTGKCADRTTLAKKMRKYLLEHAEKGENSPISH